MKSKRWVFIERGKMTGERERELGGILKPPPPLDLSFTVVLLARSLLRRVIDLKFRRNFLSLYRANVIFPQSWVIFWTRRLIARRWIVLSKISALAPVPHPGPWIALSFWKLRVLPAICHYGITYSGSEREESGTEVEKRELHSKWLLQR